MLTLFYDGQCSLCLATVNRLRQIRTRSALHFIAIQSLTTETMAAWPALGRLSQEKLLAQLHVVDEAGSYYGGSDAVMRLLRDTPSLRWIGWLGSLPGLRGISHLLYKAIARHRYQLFGKTETCEDGVCRLPARKLESGGSNE